MKGVYFMHSVITMAELVGTGSYGAADIAPLITGEVGRIDCGISFTKNISSFPDNDLRRTSDMQKNKLASAIQAAYPAPKDRNPLPAQALMAALEELAKGQR